MLSLCAEQTGLPSSMVQLLHEDIGNQRTVGKKTCIETDLFLYGRDRKTSIGRHSIIPSLESGIGQLLVVGIGSEDVCRMCLGCRK